MNQSPTYAELIADNQELRARLVEAEETLHAIRTGEVDALVVTTGAGGQQVFTLQGADYPYRVLVEEMSDGALTLTTDGLIFYANRRLAEMFKTPLEQVIGTRFEQWIVPTDQAIFTALLHPSTPPSSHYRELTLVASDGTPVLCYLSFTAIRVAALSSCFCLVATDLTEQKRNEAIMASEQLARMILEQAAEPIIVCDPDGMIIRASEVAHTLCGQNPLGQAFEQVFPLQRSDGVVFSPGVVINGGQRWQVEARLLRAGLVFELLVNAGPLIGSRGERLGSVVTLTDITQRKAAEKQIQQLAFFDPLTQLPNRRLLLDRLAQTLATFLRSGQPAALMFIDLDHFKTLNDTRGHDVGDLLLRQVGQRLSASVRLEDTVARFGGDEFVVILKDLGAYPQEAAAQTQCVGEKIQAALNQPYALASGNFHCTSSIGVTLIHDGSASVDDLLKQADLAMYQAKAAGRDTLRFFDPAMQMDLEARTLLESQLRQGLEDGQFLLYYQPQVDHAGRLIGAEALLRWQHPQRGLIAPGEFIALAEETGLILPLGQWVLETACAQLAIWARQPATAGLRLAVNFSARQFFIPDFVDQVRAALGRHDINPNQLKLELTESMLLDNIENTATKMTTLKTLGVTFSLDDFGTGYSSLTYLKRLPLDQLKIDQSFVRDVLTDANDAAIVRVIVALAHSLSLAVIAEGVETEGQREFLLRSGCRAFQGYLFGRPGPVEALWGTRPASHVAS